MPISRIPQLRGRKECDALVVAVKEQANKHNFFVEPIVTDTRRTAQEVTSQLSKKRSVLQTITHLPEGAAKRMAQRLRMTLLDTDYQEVLEHVRAEVAVLLSKEYGYEQD